ncbi:hypothetical protein [Streptomyces sp. NBC_01497]|uniref:hypothetical protein n=1 Tax=Streptomyces sp. NBC_01497 TaxID=2903885 RepID=UPI002E33B79B|nr:hypothetical protein [Streptomyces sp. NBC_01497]
MGYTVLYIAFGFVALWLLGEVLLQYKARLRWRALAFVGFVTVVVGVVLPSIVVIVLGAIAFAVGQTYVTMSFRKGYSTGWAVGGRPGASRRRRDAARGARGDEDAEGAPHPQVSDVALQAPEEQTMVSAAAPQDLPPEAGGGNPAEAAQVYAPQPMPDDTGQLYGVYDDTTSGTGQGGLGAAAFAAEGQGGHTEYAPAGYDTYGGYEQPTGHDAYGTYTGYETYGDQADQAAYAQQQQYGYGYEDQPGQGAQAGQNTPTGQDDYAAYGADGAAGQQQQQQSDYQQPEYGQAEYAQADYQQADYAQSDYQQPAYQQQYNGYDPSYAPYEAPGEQQRYQDPYATDTPPGGVWVPQQRDNASGQQAPQSTYEPSYGYDPQQQQQQQQQQHEPEREAGGPYRY